MKVCKFGGTSLASASQIRKVVDIVLAEPDRRIVVVSAPGRCQTADIKVTDLLISAAEQVTAGMAPAEAAAPVIARFESIIRELDLPGDLLDDIERDLLDRLGQSGLAPELFMDSLKAAGEDNNARLVAAALRERGADAHYVSPAEAGLVLTTKHGHTRVLHESYENIARYFAKHSGIAVFPGFFGVTEAGHVVTFPRGGSDITGSVLAAAVGADLYENFTDVDSVLVIDPDVVPDARAIEEITYREMRELSYAGFGVFHDEAILPAVQANIPIAIKNTNQPSLPGTRIVRERKHVVGRVAGIACSEGFCTVFVSKYLMNRELGFGRRFLQIFEEEGISFEHMPSGMDNISVIIREELMTAEREERILKRIRDELEPDDASVKRGLSLVMVVGEGMSHSVGLAAKATGALADAGVNIEMINQGSSEISLMFGVKTQEWQKAVRSLYYAFFE